MNSVCFSACFVLISLSIRSIAGKTSTNETEICKTAATGTGISDYNTAIVFDVTSANNLTEIKNRTMDTVAMQLRSYGILFASFARQPTLFKECLSGLASPRIFFGYVQSKKNIGNVSISPEFDLLNSNYYNLMSKLRNLEIMRKQFFESFGETPNLPTLREECRKIDPDQIASWIFDQTSEKSVSMRQLLQANLKERKDAKDASSWYQAWSWNVLHNYHRAATIAQMCRGVQTNENGDLPSDAQLTKEADEKTRSLDNMFDHLIDTELLLALTEDLRATETGAQTSGGNGLMAGVLLLLTVVLFGNF